MTLFAPLRSPTAREWLLAGLLVLIFAVDVIVPQTVLVPFLFVPLFLAALLVTPRATALLSVLAFVLAVTAGVLGGDTSTADYWIRLSAMALFATLAVVVASRFGDRDRWIARQAAEHEASSSLFQQLIDAADSPIFAKDYSEHERGQYVVTNQAWARASGVEPGRGPGLSDHDVFPPDVADTLVANDRQVLASGAPMRMHERVRSPGQDPREYVASKFPIRDTSGRVWGVAGIVTDVTDLLQAQRQEALLRQRLAAVFDASPAPTLWIAITDPAHSRILDANAAMTALVGFDLDNHDTAILLRILDNEGLEKVWQLVYAALHDDEGHHTSPGSDPRRERELTVRTDGDRRIRVMARATAVAVTDPTLPREVLLQFEEIPPASAHKSAGIPS